MAGIMYGGTGGKGGEAGAMLPSQYEYKTHLTTGKLQLWKKATTSPVAPARMISEQDHKGTWLATSVSTGIGSVHLGGGADYPVHSMSSIGQNVGFKNEAFNGTPGAAIVWFPVWQGMSVDLTANYKPTYLSFGAVQDALSINGIARSTIVPFDFVTVVASNLCVQSMTAWSTERYQGELKTIIRSYPKGVDLHASTQTVDIYSGSQFTVEVPSLYFARTGDRLQFIMQKEDGNPLSVRGGTTNTAQPWRTFRCRSFVDVNVAPQTLRKASNFTASNGDTYIIEQPVKSETGANVDTLYQYRGDIAANASHQAGNAIVLFNNNRNTATTDDAGSCGSPWTRSDENSATPFRAILDFGETVQLVGIELQGQGNTGYTTPNGPSPISGPKDTTLRFSNSPFGTTYNAQSGSVANFSKQWGNISWGANRSSPNRLAEAFNLKTANGGTAVACRYFAIDCANSWDTRSIGIRHIAFTVSTPSSASTITITVDEHVNNFNITDGNGNTAAYSPVDVVLGTDTVRLDKSFLGTTYSFLRDGSKFIVIGSDGSRTEGVV